MAQDILKPLNALLVDRSGELEAFMANSVDIPTMDVAVVSDSNAMRKKLERSQPDVIFFSPDFADPSLMEFCRNLRKTPAGANAYIILFIDKSKKEMMARAFEAGIDDFITIPFITAELLAKVKLLVTIKNIRLDQMEMRQHITGNQAMSTQNAQLRDRVATLEKDLAKDKAEIKAQEGGQKKWENESKKWESESKKWENESKKWEEESRKWESESKKWEEESKKRETDNKTKNDELESLTKKLEDKHDHSNDIARLLQEKEELLTKIQTLHADITQQKQTLSDKDETIGKLRVSLAERREDKLPLTLADKDKVALENSESAMEELDRVNRLRKYLSPTIVEKIITADAIKPFGSMAKRRHASFMFVDIRDLTQFADDLDPKLLTQLITETFDHILDTVSTFGGVVNKFFGDSLLAIFNDPVPVKEHALRAMQAACRIKHLAQHHQERPGLLRSPFHVAVAVHTGEAVFGNFGTHQQIDYTAVGRDVTMTARLLGFSLADEIIVTKSTYESLLPQVSIRQERQVTVKGFEEPIWIADLTAVLR